MKNIEHIIYLGVRFWVFSIMVEIILQIKHKWEKYTSKISERKKKKGPIP